MYFDPELVSFAFKRLSPRDSEGKKHMERTSALLYFLSFDAVCGQSGQPFLDLNPDTSSGRKNRKLVELEFLKLTVLENSFGHLKQVIELGKICEGGKKPEKRISSNFLTVPLKKASEQSKPYLYPSRPAPLLKMGMIATTQKWGVAYNDNWKSSLPKFMAEIKHSTPFTDLAIFVLRDSEFSEENIYPALLTLLKQKYTSDLSRFWIDKIEKERILAKHIAKPPIREYRSFVAVSANNTPSGRKETLHSMQKSSLIERVLYLEGLLEENKISISAPDDEEM